MEDAGNAVAAILVNPAQYLNSTMSLFSDFHSCNDIVRELSSTLGRDVSYVHTSMKVMEKNLKDMGVPEWQAKGVIRNCKVDERETPKGSRRGGCNLHQCYWRFTNYPEGLGYKICCYVQVDHI